MSHAESVASSAVFMFHSFIFGFVINWLINWVCIILVPRLVLLILLRQLWLLFSHHQAELRGTFMNFICLIKSSFLDVYNCNANVKNQTNEANFVLIGRLIAKYRPMVPVLAVVVPRLKTNSLKCTFSGTSQVKWNFPYHIMEWKIRTFIDPTSGLQNNSHLIFQLAG